MADLSPAAQAVYDAAHTADSMPAASLADAMAAVLRAAVHGVDYITSEEILAIAAELDNTRQPS
jgi:hypothetical protein